MSIGDKIKKAQEEIKKAQKKIAREVKSKSKGHGLHSSTAWKREYKSRRKEREKQSATRAKKTDLQQFNEKVRKNKALQKKRQKYTGHKEEIGFQDKTINRDDRVKRAEKKQGVRYGGSNFWYVK